MTILGCQCSEDAVSGENVLKRFIHDFLVIKYDESSSETDLNNQLINKAEGEFTKEGYTSFIRHNYGLLPIQAVTKDESDFKVKVV